MGVNLGVPATLPSKMCHFASPSKDANRHATKEPLRCFIPTNPLRDFAAAMNPERQGCLRHGNANNFLRVPVRKSAWILEVSSGGSVPGAGGVTSLGSRGVTEDVELPKNSPLLLATALRLLRLLCTVRAGTQSGKHLNLSRVNSCALWTPPPLVNCNPTLEDPRFSCAWFMVPFCCWCSRAAPRERCHVYSDLAVWHDDDLGGSGGGLGLSGERDRLLHAGNRRMESLTSRPDRKHVAAN